MKNIEHFFNIYFDIRGFDNIGCLFQPARAVPVSRE